jgi:TM2 domain-containing membrane protein YozV
MLWCALLGGVGAHRFYLGQKGFGLLYLCFCWTFVPLIASWIDLAIMAAQDDEDFAEEQRETPLLQPLGYDGALRGKHQSLAHKDRSA